MPPKDTDKSDASPAVELSDAQKRFILHWGEMGTRWGINRTVAQIHALLFVWPDPLNAEQIAATLAVARSNVSNSLRELQGWNLVQVVHHMGDRRDYFRTFDDVWEMYRVVLDERKRREIDPTLSVLRACVAEARKQGDTHTHQRLKDMLGFIETMSHWYDQMRQLPPAAFSNMARAGSKLMKLFGGGKRK